MAKLTTTTAAGIDSAASPTSFESSDVEVSIFHEHGNSAFPEPIRREINIDRDSPPDRVVVHSQVVGRNGPEVSSPQYLATRRRRAAKKLLDILDEIHENEFSPHLSATTHRMLERLRLVAVEFSSAERFSRDAREGNSCEVFRQLRDSLIAEGWKRYRESIVRQKVKEILTHLARADEVTSEYVSDTMDQLMDLDISPVSMPTIQYGDEEETEKVLD